MARRPSYGRFAGWTQVDYFEVHAIDRYPSPGTRQTTSQNKLEDYVSTKAESDHDSIYGIKRKKTNTTQPATTSTILRYLFVHLFKETNLDVQTLE
ncbi:hypothetical protein M404DRAFT_20497 [Pisolithus tinctorius Marx 270]|uniref:Uncharacterized protein n=1 Tax=Pisolithus tinctorius Marx 270 TaxID=870435 RepID=A0A0C3JS05_PISTI|nr:hypothetical protein M404DRAFT_20497 [Pisolithus tinctorius Marx 270]